MSQATKPHSDSERYKFLRDQFALHSENDEADFSKLARLTGSDFDAAIDAAMDEEVAA